MKETKVYLNIIDDIIKALNDGKTLFMEYTGDDDDINYNSKIKCFNGILIQETKDNNIYLNPGDLSLKRYKFYFKGKQPLKLEVGKFYKTRDGKKVICAYKSKQKADDRPYFFSSVGGYELFSTWTTENGFCSEDEKENYKRDVVDYWDE